MGADRTMVSTKCQLCKHVNYIDRYRGSQKSTTLTFLAPTAKLLSGMRVQRTEQTFHAQQYWYGENR